MALDLWIQTDSAKNGGQFLIDADTRVRPVASEGGSLNIYLGAFKFDAPVDLSGYERVNLLIKESQTDTDPALVDTDVLIGSITSPITLSGWNAQTAYNGVWSVPAAEMVYDLGAEEYKDLWIVFTAYNDSSGSEVTLGASSLRLIADNNVGIPGGPDNMLKSIYDTNNDGKVDAADVADAVAYANITGLPGTFPADLTGAVRYDAVQSLSAGQKTQAQTNIEAVNAAAVTADIAAKAVRFDAVQSLSGSEKTQARDNIGVAEALSAGSVLYDTVMGLNSSQQGVARTNILASDSAEIAADIAAKSVRYDATQALTTDQKTVARNNIGAPSSVGEVSNRIIQHLKTVDTILGATPSDLQDYDTAGVTDDLPAPYSFLETSTGYLRIYILTEGDGTEVHSSPDVILPNDYNDPTNLRYFQLATATNFADGSVRYDAVQALSTGEKLQARQNIDAAGTAGIPLWDSIYTGFYGNTSTDIDSKATTTLTVGSLQSLYIPYSATEQYAGLQTFELVAKAAEFGAVFAVDTVNDRLEVTTSATWWANTISDRFKFTIRSTGTVPGGTAENTVYYAKPHSTGTGTSIFEIYADRELTSLVNISTAGTGTVEVYRVHEPQEIVPVDYDDSTNQRVWVRREVEAMVEFQMMVHAEDEAISVATSHWMYAPCDMRIERIFAECENAQGDPIFHINMGGVVTRDITISTAAGYGTGKYTILDSLSKIDEDVQHIKMGERIAVKVTDAGTVSAATSKGLIVTLFARPLFVSDFDIT